MCLVLRKYWEDCSKIFSCLAVHKLTWKKRGGKDFRWLKVSIYFSSPSNNNTKNCYSFPKKKITMFWISIALSTMSHKHLIEILLLWSSDSGLPVYNVCTFSTPWGAFQPDAYNAEQTTWLSHLTRYLINTQVERSMQIKCLALTYKWTIGDQTRHHLTRSSVLKPFDYDTSTLKYE